MAKLPTIEIVEGLIRNGWSYAMIGKEFDVTENAVYRKLARAGKVGNTIKPDEYLPWEVDPYHRKTSIYQTLLAIQRLEEGRTVSGERKTTAENLMADLKKQNMVVGYLPNMPANDASPTRGGFFYTTRTQNDRDYFWEPPVT